MSIGKNNHRKEKGIKIIDPEKIDYTFTDKDDPFNIKSSLFINEKNIDSSSKSKTEKKNTDRIRFDLSKNTKTRTKGRIAGGQSKQAIRLCMNKETTMRTKKKILLVDDEPDLAFIFKGLEGCRIKL